MNALTRLYRRFERKGFTGPRYAGWRGKLRLLSQGWFGHREVVLYAEPEWWTPDENVNPDVRLELLPTFEDCRRFLPEFEAAYFKDFEAEFREFYSWGQLMTVALVGGELAGFGWLQDGAKGAKCHYMKLRDREYRAFRSGVVPRFRRQKIHATRHRMQLQMLFGMGARRVYVEAFEDNEYSWRAHLKAGYREFGRIEVRSPLRGGSFVRWVE